MSKRIVAKVGEYEKDGETKGRYQNIGVILSNDNGEYVLLDPVVNLAGVLIQQRLLNPQKAGEKVLASVFTDEPRQNSQPAQQQSSEDFSDPIPF